MEAKKLGESDIIGQRGVNFVERVCLDMGFLWRPTPLFDTGIDGTIEIRDEVTGIVTNSLIHVQVKSTTRNFVAETDTTFEYVCSKKDLDYWLSGNAPIILVVARPETDEAYWVAIKDYFNTPTKLQSRRIHFSKQDDRFDITCKHPLRTLAIPQDSGVYFSPPPCQEILYSNLLTVASFSPTLYLAETDFRRPKELWQELDRLETGVGGEWILTNKRILSFYDLSEFPWSQLCDIGTVEAFDVEEWSLSHDLDRQRDFVQLINRCLKEKARTLDLRFNADDNIYYFKATSDLSPRIVRYQSLKQVTKRTVFEGYPSKKNPSKIAYYRHSAFRGYFQRFDDDWHLEITPTYYFTWNGYKSDIFGEERLKGIKRLEKNPAVLGQTVMWAEYLKKPPDLFSTEYQFLKFGELLKYEVDFGINDEMWLPNKNTESSPSGTDEQQLSLF